MSEASFTYLRGPRLISPPLDTDQTKQRAPLKNIYIFPVYCCVLESFFNKKRSFLRNCRVQFNSFYTKKCSFQPKKRSFRTKNYSFSFINPLINEVGSLLKESESYMFNALCQLFTGSEKLLKASFSDVEKMPIPKAEPWLISEHPLRWRTS